MHEGEGSAREISNDSTRYVRRSENPGKKNSVGLTDMVPVDVGLRQTSSLRPYLFAIEYNQDEKTGRGYRGF